MVRIAKLVQAVNAATRSLIALTGAGGKRRTVRVTAPAGIDSAPLPDDYAVVAADQTGREYVLGVPSAAGVAPGGLRLFARAGGSVVAEVVLLPDSSITLSNAAGSISIDAAGMIDLNGVKILPDGTLQTADGRILSTHTHPETGGTTGPNT